MNFKDLKLKQFYDSDTDDILNSFYIPTLEASVKYQRLAGFFSSASLAVAARGIAGLIANKGKMELICSAKLKQKDVEAVLNANINPAELIEKDLIEELSSRSYLENKIISDHVNALGWMVANGFLDIKIAIVKNRENRPLNELEITNFGIFHQKVGILYDSKGNIISFSGSDNETANAWLNNIEEFKVFCSWDEMQKKYIEADQSKFLKFWHGCANRVESIDVPLAVKKKLIEMAPDNIDNIIIKIKSHYVQKKKEKVKLWPKQNEAIKKWINNEKQCIFEMATGTGKTFAALGCLAEVFKEKKEIISIIACPYNHLITQWKEDIENFGLQEDLIIADRSNSKWKNQLMDYIMDINNEVKERLIILTSHDTFYSKDFINMMNLSNCEIFIIGDEVHGMWSDKRKEGFLDKYNLRLGLSATPSRWFDPTGTQELLSYFNIKNDDAVFKFSLEEAIKTINPATDQTYLTPYDYFPHFIDLTDEEMDRYIQETKRIAKSYHASKTDEDKLNQFNLLCIRRQNIIKNAENKYEVFEEILDDIENVKHCLVYCSSGQITNVQEILNRKGIVQHKFTEKEGTSILERYGDKSERDHLLDHFTKGTYQALVAMRCLDEGVDIPQAEIGIILSSTGNPRQYIQRRGRLLRRSPGKKKAFIHDIIVFPTLSENVPGELYEIEKKIIKNEMKRYEEFARSADNVIDCLTKINDIEKKIFGRK